MRARLGRKVNAGFSMALSNILNKSARPLANMTEKATAPTMETGLTGSVGSDWIGLRKK
jgi:hypothetical protein